MCVEGTQAAYERVSVLEVSMRLEDEFKIDDKMADALTKDDLKEVKNVIIDLSSRTQEILIQQDRENKKEEMFTKSMNKFQSKSVWMSVAQMATVVICGFYIVMHMRSFFNK